jgi:hypothetical protein
MTQQNRSELLDWIAVFIATHFFVLSVYFIYMNMGVVMLFCMVIPPLVIWAIVRCLYIYNELSE